MNLMCDHVFLVLITTVNCLSVKLAAFVQNFLTAAKLLIIFVIVVAGIAMLAQGVLVCYIHTQYIFLSCDNVLMYAVWCLYVCRKN